MKDLFISYASENCEQIEPLVHALERNGWSVWWDRNIPVGKRYDEVILQALEKATCVIVVWTKASVESDWVRDEATRGHEESKLFPIRLEDVTPPLGFGVIQAANLVGWDGKTSHKEFTRLVQAIQNKCAPSFIEGTIPPPLPARQKLWPIVLLFCLPIFVAILSLLIPLGMAEVELGANVSEFSFVSTTRQEFSDPLRITSYKAAGLKTIHIPRSAEFPEDSITIEEDGLGTIIVTSGQDQKHPSLMTIDTMVLETGSSVRFVKTSVPLEYGITMNTSNVSLKVNVNGSMDIKLPAMETKNQSFAFPNPLTLQSGPNGLNMEIILAEPVSNVLPSPLLSVTNLGFVRVDERRGEDRTTVQKVSTILDGSFSLNGEPHQLTSKEYLQFERSEGSLQTIRLNQNHLEVEFRGQVQGMKSCQDETPCTNLMPTYWEWLMGNYLLPVMVMGLVYFLLAVILAMRWWKVRL